LEFVLSESGRTGRYERLAEGSMIAGLKRQEGGNDMREPYKRKKED
jgi:hypothetical protein